MTCMRAMPVVRSQTGSVHAGPGLEVTQITALAKATCAVQSSTVFVQPVLTGIVNDFIMRCHTTLWFGPAACHPFGYCMCVRKHNKKIVGGYVKKVTQPFLAGRKAYACDKKLVLTDQQLVEMGARAQAITNALSADGPRAFHFSMSQYSPLHLCWCAWSLPSAARKQFAASTLSPLHTKRALVGARVTNCVKGRSKVSTNVCRRAQSCAPSLGSSHAR